MQALNKSITRRMYLSIHRLICIGIFALGAINAHAQIHTNTESIRLHGNMSMGETNLNLTLITKGQNKLRATIRGKNHLTRAHIIHNQEQLWTKNSINGQESVRQLEGKNAAENLLDLLALNPEFHFKDRNGFDLSSPIFEGYSIEYTQSEKPNLNTGKCTPKALQLSEITDGEAHLIRSIRYISFQKKTTPFIQPKELTLTDEITGEIGKIVIHKVVYNTPLANFLFELPKVTN
ncbi:MAG: hypothetical protein P8P52_01725 [Opitutae bacterium]|nr:hypothetical protein [Opitutae bacterium]